MAKNYIESPEVVYTREDSPENVRALLERERLSGGDLHAISQKEEYLSKYPDEFSALYAIADKAKGTQIDGKTVHMNFDEDEYHRPAIVPESDDLKDPEKQVVLKCDLGDGLKFSLSAMKSPDERADKEEGEMPKMMGQISFDDETVKNLNAERLNRIFEFCSKYGFSTFGLKPAMNGDEIDIDASLQDLLEKYNETQKKLQEEEAYTLVPKPSEDENDPSGMREEDFHMLASADAPSEEETKEPQAEPSETMALPENPSYAAGSKGGVPLKKKELTVDDVAENIRTFLRKDLHKREGLSYWEHSRIIDGRQTYVFSIYPTEDSTNWDKDGRKKDDKYVATFAARLYVSQDKNGKFYFGYATPDGKQFDSTLAKQFMGEIKKTGVTHINLQNVPACDQDTLMFAAASRGIVPTGVNITSAKAKEILEKIGKLTAEEQATFKRRLANQMLENAKNSHKDALPPQYGLPDSEFDFIQDLREKAEDDASNIAALPMKRKFKNFKDAVEDKGPEGLYTKMKKTAEKGKADREKGAATICGAAHAFNAVFDLYFKHFDETLGQRIAPMIESGEITKQEAIKLAPLSSKVLGQMDSKDFALIYDVLLPRKIQQTEADILEAYRLRYAENSTDTRPPANILQQDIFPKAKDALAEVNARLKRDSIPELYIPFENKVMSYAVPEYLRPKKKKDETSKPAAVPTASRESR